MRSTAWRAATLLVVLAGLSSCARHSAAPAKAPDDSGARVMARTDAEFLGRPGSFRVYAVSDGDTHAQLRIDKSGSPAVPELLLSAWKGAGPESFAPDPAISIQQRMLLFGPLFRRYLQEGGPGPRFLLLVYGYRELDRRLTCLAARDRGWNRTLGQPVQGQNGTTYFEHLLADGDADAEVEQALAAFHYSVTLAGGLENLRVAPVSRFTPDQRSGLCVDAKPSDLLPVRIGATFTATGLPR